MLKIVEIFSFTKINLYMNVIIIFFIYIFLKPSTSEFTIKNKNYHTHCSKHQTKIKQIDEEDNYVNLEEDGEYVQIHTHDNKPNNYVSGHSHTMDDEIVRKPQISLNYNEDNIYSSVYDRNLEYMLKGFVVLIVLINTVVLNKILL
jgi:hypothetical protein